MRLTPSVRGCVRFRTAPTRAFARSRRVTTAGSVAIRSMLSTSPMRRRRCGLSGIAIWPSGVSHRCSSSPAMCGATGCKASTWPISAPRTDWHGSGWFRRGRAAEAGLPIRAWARRSGRRGGTDFWRRAQRGPRGSCSASSLKIRPSCRSSRSRRQTSSPSRRCRQPACAPDPQDRLAMWILCRSRRSAWERSRSWGFGACVWFHLAASGFT